MSTCSPDFKSIVKDVTHKEAVFNSSGHRLPEKGWWFGTSGTE